MLLQLIITLIASASASASSITRFLYRENLSLAEHVTHFLPLPKHVHGLKLFGAAKDTTKCL